MGSGSNHVAVTGAPGPSAYHEIDFHSPLAMRIDKDWSYLGIAG